MKRFMLLPVFLFLAAPALAQQVVVTRGDVRVDRNHTLLVMTNHSGRDFAVDLNHDARRILLRAPEFGGMRLASNTAVQLVARKGDWDLRVEGHEDKAEVKMRGGERTSVTLRPVGVGALAGVSATCDDSERVRSFTLIPAGRPVVVRPAPVVVTRPAPIVVTRPNYVVQPNPVIVTPAPIIRPAPRVHHYKRPPSLATPLKGLLPIIVPDKRHDSRNSTSINIDLNFGDKNRDRDHGKGGHRR